ncbi:NAD(P)/FAD-dependent oxidoreductase [Chelatococcus asaccharovorans]|uniref:Glycine/D-amino acid oxidase-like deaminating enzyme n=1 Tax=Chelatococcus asaccharovorans TaxID=28210 RepID=A0A2V3U6H4_9HYPH|nr:FAD-binding oxidoreductase [Chelatococcus asaccharovorans]MBS7704166.1 FAD-binding oxidoreductase [Chelatococcus asaccharovorans]PXW53207.1 glycine/D-amino acid oxidase-like deaminating enzyme [Chelatococcus asaccharovorans]CAH1665743.1 Glycine/D-amino acid oxidase-like deaminating enzyme [Chelatococcus asaccharovorans]CAH1681805.1 Glycine/D-amino acid oxidase-like deaminating enzyme [Chelatococcus asaccharovorans]
MQSDVVVLGAGIVGISVALHLQKRGRSVVLLDRRGPAQETSFGNAGLVQSEGVYPYGFPHDFGALLRYGLNRTIDAHYHPSALLDLAPFLWKYWHHSRPARHAAIAKKYATLIAHCVSEHDALAREANATHYFKREGWFKVFRTPQQRDLRLAEAERWHREFGLAYRALDLPTLEAEEPHLAPVLIGGLHWTEPTTINDPHGLAVAYFDHFAALGGRYVQGNAATLENVGQGWRVVTPEGPLTAGAAVVALGPWADMVTKPLGYRLPLAVKRGYHMHYRPAGDAKLNHPVLDTERGYFLVPMARGIRLTTGAEFARRDGMKTPVQLARAEPIAREFFPLAERLDNEPWMGARPCTPDMMPIIGKAPRHPNLWFSFGHAHHGLTLGPVTGRLVAEMITGETPFVDPTPFRVDRF